MDSSVIYVVDDDAAVRTAVRRLLMTLKRPVRLFGSAEDFLEQADGSALGCLILDVRLPGMTGLQLQEALVEWKWTLPVIFITAHDDPDARELALRRGAVAYIRKPFDRTELLEGLSRALDRSSA